MHDWVDRLVIGALAAAVVLLLAALIAVAITGGGENVECDLVGGINAPVGSGQSVWIPIYSCEELTPTPSAKE